MSVSVLKYFNPKNYVDYARLRIAEMLEAKPRWSAEECYRRYQAGFAGNSRRVIVCEGMMDNPNHFFRLHMMLAAMPDAKDCRLVCILRNRDEVNQQRTLESLGAKEFVYLEDHARRLEQFMGTARQLLNNVRSHRDLLELELPHSLPAYVFYDTVLKVARHPQPPLDSPLWTVVLAEVLRNLTIYEDLFGHHEVVRVVSSHPWKNEYATLCWTAITHAVPCYHVTGFCEGVRIRRFRMAEDFATPVEHCSFADFSGLPASVREGIVERGRAYLSERESGKSTDINARYAFRPDKRPAGKPAARRVLGVPEHGFLAVVCAPVWFDFPHTFAMWNFTDFLDWVKFTVDQIGRNTSVTWLLKPHPCDSWYGGVRLADLAGNLPPHVHLCPEATDALTAQLAADAVVTVHGTVAIEAAARGVPVLCADQSYYSDWGFTHTAKSREEYAQGLANIQNLVRPTEEQQKRAMAVAALSLSPAPEALGLLRTSCDSSERRMLYGEIVNRFEREKDSLLVEQNAIGEWLAGSSPSYAACQTINHYARMKSE